jgi:phosphotransferase system HPr (HPr) family protein
MHDAATTHPATHKCVETKEYLIHFELGMTLQRAAMLAMAAARYDAVVTVACNGPAVNARSLLALTLLDAEWGETLTVTARGPGASQVMSAIDRVLDPDFRPSPFGLRGFPQPRRAS